MEKTIERLKKQENELCKQRFKEGQKDGFELAKNMNYADIQSALNYKTTNYWLQRERIINWDPCSDKIFGDYFKDIFQEGGGMYDYEETGSETAIPNKAFREWEDGFISGIKNFWDEVKDKI